MPLDPAADSPDVLPSLIYVDRAEQVTLGTPAADEYLRHETGRPVVWEKRSVGEIEVFRAEQHYIEAMSVITDVGAHGRLLQSVKTALRDPVLPGHRDLRSLLHARRADRADLALRSSSAPRRTSGRPAMRW